jgi:hypothetical protein
MSAWAIGGSSASKTPRAPSWWSEAALMAGSRIAPTSSGTGYEDLDIAAGDTASAALEALLLERDSLSARS